MKIRLEIDLELPIDVPILDLRDIVWDNYVNYVTCAHLRDALKWCGKAEQDGPDSNSAAIFQVHQNWGEICTKANFEIKNLERAKMKREYYVWKNVCKKDDDMTLVTDIPDDTSGLRFITPLSNPEEHETPMDLMFDTMGEAYQALLDYGCLEIAFEENWLLCRETVENFCCVKDFVTKD